MVVASHSLPTGSTGYGLVAQVVADHPILHCTDTPLLIIVLMKKNILPIVCAGSEMSGVGIWKIFCNNRVKPI